MQPTCLSDEVYVHGLPCQYQNQLAKLVKMSLNLGDNTATAVDTHDEINNVHKGVIWLMNCFDKIRCIYLVYVYRQCKQFGDSGIVSVLWYKRQSDPGNWRPGNTIIGWYTND